MAKRKDKEAAPKENQYLTKIDTDSDLREIITDRFKYTVKHYENWEKEAKEDYKFAMGDQWSKEDRDALAEQGRPCLTFNRIKPLINIVGGYQRENSSRIKVNPEGGEDRIFSEVMDRGLKAIDKWAKLSYKEGYLFDDGSYTGKGWLEASLAYDKDPIRGDIRFNLRTPYQIMPDPDFRDYDLNEGCRYCFKVVRLSKSEIKELYPKYADLIDAFAAESDDPNESIDSNFLLEGDADNYGNNPNPSTVSKARVDIDKQRKLGGDEKLWVKEYWHIKMVDRFFVVEVESSMPRKFDTEDEAKVFIAEQKFGKVIKRKVPAMYVAAMVCGWIVQEEEISPFEPYYSGYPFFRFLGDWAPNAEEEELRVQGIVRPLKDPQREKNKAKSQNLHILNTQANSGWIGDEDALDDQGWQSLEQMGSKPGITIKKKKGSELREILPKGPNAGQLQREQAADEEFKQISGVNADLMGFQEGTASGRAISMRIKQAVLSLARMFHNYRYTKEIIGVFLLQMVPMIFDTKKLMRVIGPEYMRKATDPEKYPQGLSEGNLKAFLTMVEDHRYDVYVTEADQNSTIRFEIFQELVEILKTGVQLPPDLIIDYMDLPNAEEVKARIKEQQQANAAAALAAKGKTGPTQ